MSIMESNRNCNLNGLSKQIVKERPCMRSGVLSLSNIRGRMRFGRYIFGDNTNDMRNDWIAVGDDIRKALTCYGK